MEMIQGAVGVELWVKVFTEQNISWKTFQRRLITDQTDIMLTNYLIAWILRRAIIQDKSNMGLNHLYLITCFPILELKYVQLTMHDYKKLALKPYNPNSI